MCVNDTPHVPRLKHMVQALSIILVKSLRVILFALSQQSSHEEYEWVIHMNPPILLTWISNHIHYKVWDEITYPFQTSGWWSSLAHLLVMWLIIHGEIKVNPC